MPPTEEFRNAVFQIVRQIPKGKVLTYGRIAVLAGRPQNSRLVGKCLAFCPEDVPAFRVVNHQGRTVPSWTEQVMRLKKEKIAFKENGCVNLKLHLWKP